MKFVLLLISILFAGCSSINTQRETKAKAAPPVKIKPVAVPNLDADKLFALASQSFNKGEFNKAFDFFSACTKKYEKESRVLESHLWAVRSLSKAGRHFEVLQYIENTSSLKWSAVQSNELLKYALFSAKTSGDQLTLLRKIDLAVRDPLMKDEQLKYLKIFEAALPAVEKSVSLDSELSKMLSGQTKSLGYFFLAEESRKSGDIEKALDYYKTSRELDPESDTAKKSNENILILEASKRVEYRNIGVVLPLTGKESVQAQKVLRALQLGLGINSSSRSNYQLSIADTGGDPKKAKAAVEKLVSEDHVIAIVGSILSREATIVAETAASLGVPTIGLSQKAGLTEISPLVFRNALTAEVQTHLLAKEAIEKMNIKKFAILFPNDSFGVEYANKFWDSIVARGGSVTAAQPYRSGETDFTKPIQRLVGSYDPSLRQTEYNLRNLENKSRVKKLRENDASFSNLPPIVTFDAIFIPDTSKSLGQISATLVSMGVKTPVLLGTNLWNVSDLAKRAGAYSDRILLVDSYASNSDVYVKSKFTSDYITAFAEEPGNLEFQAFDSGAILKQLIDQGSTSRSSLSANLYNLESVDGSVGKIYMSKRRELIRPAMALTLKDGKVVNFQ